MKWKQVAAEAEFQKLVGKTITSVKVDSEGDNIKNIHIEADGMKVRLGVSWETLRCFLPLTRFKVTGKFDVGNIKAEIEPEMFDTIEEAQEKLTDLLNEFPSFKGKIDEVQE